MPSPAWTYSDWITYASGTSTRLSRFRLHIQEVSNAIQSGSYSTEGKSHSVSDIQAYLDKLLALEPTEAAASAVATGQRTSFTRGRVI